MIPETVRRGFKAAWTPPYGPTYISWHSDFNDEKTYAEIIAQDKVDPRMRVRPNPAEVERAARLLVEAKMPLLIVGDEVYTAKAVAKAVKLAELLGMPVTQARQIYANFPEAHPLWVGSPPADAPRVAGLPEEPRRGASTSATSCSTTARSPSSRATRSSSTCASTAWSMGNVMPTEVPLVADVALRPGRPDRRGRGTDDLRRYKKARSARRRCGASARKRRRCARWCRRTRTGTAARCSPTASPRRSRSSPTATRSSSTRQARWCCTASISTRCGGRELFFYYGAHLGSGVGTAAGVKLARPNQQVICLVGDGSFVFGPTALWNMARLELPVITVVYNNHAYGGPHSRVIEKVAGGKMVQKRQFVHDYLGSPDMNMASIAKGFGVDGEVVESPEQLRAALARARKATVEGKPYLIDAQIARVGVAWDDKPWIPPISIARERTRKV